MSPSLNLGNAPLKCGPHRVDGTERDTTIRPNDFASVWSLGPLPLSSPTRISLSYNSDGLVRKILSWDPDPSAQCLLSFSQRNKRKAVSTISSTRATTFMRTDRCTQIGATQLTCRCGPNCTTTISFLPCRSKGKPDVRERGPDGKHASPLQGS